MKMKENNQEIASIEIRKNLITGAAAGGALGAIFGYAIGSLWLSALVGILVGLAIGFRLRTFSPKMRYPMFMIRRMLLAGTLAMVTTFGYAFLLDNSLNKTQTILAALVPTAAIAIFVLSLAAAIASLDELQRRIQTEAIAIGFAGTAIFCLGYGLMETAGGAPLNWGGVTLVMVVMWLIGKIWTLWRYR
jgi:hypothetical protein